MLEIGFGLFLRPRSTEVLDFGPPIWPLFWGLEALEPGLGPSDPVRSGLSKPWRPQAKIRPCRVLVALILVDGIPPSGTSSERTSLESIIQTNSES